MLSIVVLALASLSATNALVIPRTPDADPNAGAPASYAVGYLEPYSTYHERYLALNCETQHDTTFFNDCCHPMLATENLKENRPAQCTPSDASVSSADPTSTDCDDDESSTPVAAPTQGSQAPQNVAPEPSAPEATPTPSSSPAPEPKPSSSPAPKATSTSSSSGLGDTLGNIISGGVATFFFQNGVAGACGTVHQDSDFVVALPTKAYDNGKNCGRKLKVINPATGESQIATVADECPTCDNDQCLDLSKSLFNAFASDSVGEFKMQYAYID